MRIRAVLNGLGSYRDKVYFFLGDRYRRYSWGDDRLDDGGSLPAFVWHLPPAFRETLDAAASVRVRGRDVAYFFRGGHWVCYDWQTSRVVREPSPVADGWGLPEPFASHLDAVLPGRGPQEGMLFFVSQGRWARYDLSSGRVDGIGELVSWGIPREFSLGFDAAVPGGGTWEGKAYFLMGEHYVRYDWEHGRVDAGHPLSVAANWPALLGLRAAPRRRLVLYVTIDPVDHRRGVTAGGHAPNLARVTEIAGGWDPELFVDDFWCEELGAKDVADPHLLAVIMAGSFTDWHHAFARPEWRAALDRCCALVRGTSVPVLAVCGSHQLVAYAYGGFEAVGHLARTGAEPISIADEADGVLRRPVPPLSERGVFGLRAVESQRDPLLACLPQPFLAVESHQDEVQVVPSAAVLLLGPDQEGEPWQTSPPEERVLVPGERCRVQALRYLVPPEGRLLYTTQFHPELLAPGGCPWGHIADAHGRHFLESFLGLAARYWREQPVRRASETGQA